MAVYYVFQGETYDEERVGGYVWSPQLNKRGRKNAGYTMMTNIRKGDFILHNSNGRVVAISIAKSDCYVANQPHELSIADTTIKWDDKGYRIDLNYYDFDAPVIATNYKQWLIEHYIEGSAFTKKGAGKQRYMCHLADEHAIFLIEKAISLQKNKGIINHLNDALSEIIGDKESEYSQVEMDSINDLVSNIVIDPMPTWEGKKMAQAMMTSPKTGREIPKRDPQRAVSALRYAGFQCEFNNDDRTFLRKNGNQYTEPHHLIPISKYRDFDYSVDVMENIVSLCSHCHNLLHYGRIEDKTPILKKLYNERKEALNACGLCITFDQLIAYYH